MGNPGSVTCSGQIIATYTWTPDSVGDNSSPANSLCVLETVRAGADCLARYHNSPIVSSASASDSFGDTPSFGYDSPGNPYGCMIVSQHVIAVSVPLGTLVVNLPPVSFSSAITIAGGQTTAGGSLKATSVNFDLLAQSTAGTTDSHQPQWFSGTNCQASGTIGVDTSLISRAQLLINDQVVNSYPDPSSPTKTPNLSAAFDSTHFSDGSTITIKYKVWDTAGDPPVEKTLAAPTSNKGLVCGDPHADDKTPFPGLYEPSITAYAEAESSIETELNGINTPAYRTESYHKSDILAELPSDTVFYINTHGVENSFGDCFDNGEGEPIVMGDISNGSNGVVDRKHMFYGPGSSQFPVTWAIPPFNFVMLDCCDGADDPSVMGGAFIGSPSQDRAFLGWDNFLIQIVTNADWTQRLWNNLSQGYSLLDAEQQATADGVPPLGGQLLGSIPEFLPLTPKIYGDASMTLHGVYGGQGFITGTPSTSWFRPL